MTKKKKPVHYPLAPTTLEPSKVKTLPGLFRARVAATPDKIAYRHYDVAGQQWHATTWDEIATEVGRCQAALKREGLEAGDRVAVMLKNCREWVVFDTAALGLGLVVVPLYTDDRPENAAYIMEDAGVRMLLVEGKKQWKRLQQVSSRLENLLRIVSVNTIEKDDKPKDTHLISMSEWLFGIEGKVLAEESRPGELATIVYTSGTTGKPKGVMLSHDNILSNAWGAAHCGRFSAEDRFLSFLPLSHMLERMAGLYFPMMIGAEVVYSRGINQLGDDLVTQKPTTLVSVPRIYERVYARIMGKLRKDSAFKRKIFEKAVATGWKRFEYQQGRGKFDKSILLWPIYKRLVADKILERLGGRLRYAICGGAAMPPDIARVFIGLGLPMVQGYGMTETSPVICVNRPDNNIPESIGQALPGVEVRIGEKDELQTRSRSVMLGYWNNQQATDDTIDSDGWLHTGDQVRVNETGHYFITGRIKEIIVLGNGEKVPPADMEMAVAMDPLIEQIMVVGEARSYLVALAVLDPAEWKLLARELGVDANDPESLRQKFVEKAVLARISQQLASFPGYAQIRRVHMLLEPWTVDGGLLTPTLKMKRPQITQQFSEEIEALYRR
jgi:long-chain acyl-CoA synthetase